jgi:hypothetical protein
MALLQILAARMAGVSKLVFHIGLDVDFHPFGEVNALLGELASGNQVSVQTLLDQITDLGFSWGIINPAQRKNIKLHIELSLR